MVCWTGQHAPPHRRRRRRVAGAGRHYQRAEDQCSDVCTSMQFGLQLQLMKLEAVQQFNRLQPIQRAVILVFSCIELTDDKLFAWKMEAP